MVVQVIVDVLLCSYFRAIVLSQCYILCHIVVQVIVMRVSSDVSFFDVGAIFCESGHDFGLDCFLLFYKCCC